MIVVREIVKRFGRHNVLDRLSLSVRQGEVAVIVGPSGGGKSTFLRCLNGLESFEEGEVTLDGLTLRPDLPHRERHATLQNIRRRVGMVFQQFHLFPHRSVLENVIEGPVHVLHQSLDEAIALAEELLARVGLKEKLQAMPDTLSGGQQQRVAIARALAMKPTAILFDEPTSALDPIMAGEVESVMADLAAEGQTMIVVTHSMGLARRTAHTLHVFAGGKAVESGPPDIIFEAPQHETTQAFLRQCDRV